MECFNCYTILLLHCQNLSANNVAFVIIAETLPVLFIIILFETKTNNNDNTNINSDVGCLTRPTNFIEAPMRIVRVRDHADKGE
jgi:hypothetical protein